MTTVLTKFVFIKFCSVLDPDGKVRVVQYTADKVHGFQAKVITDGHVIHHPQHGPAEQGVDDGGYQYPVVQHHPPPPPPSPLPMSHDHMGGNGVDGEGGGGEDEDDYGSNESGDYEGDDDGGDEDGGDEDGDEDYY